MTAHVLVSGFVQGVGYRRFIRHQAQKLGLTGWVKNLSDNRVEAIFQGPKEHVEKIIEICRKGPFLSEVADVKLNLQDSNEYFKTFEIVR